MTKQNLSINKGDVFRLGDHLLVCGSCTDTNLVSKVLEGIKVKLILTDPPYGVSYVESKESLGKKVSVSKEIKNDDISSYDNYREFTTNWLEPIVPFLETKNGFYVFNGDKMLLPFLEALRDMNFKFSQLLIWVKSQPIVGRKDFSPQHELILFGWYGVHEFMKSKDRSILFHPKPQSNKLHPTMKPISLLRRLILNSTSLNDIIYDPFGGSGSTLISCEHTKRRCVMFEIDPDYCMTIIQRWEKLTGKEAVRHE